MEHYGPLTFLGLAFFGSLFASLIIGFALHARKYGINNAWRDLVFGWPIPYWMRFVPKDEQKYGPTRAKELRAKRAKEGMAE